jgi:CheY-like chemotaxis protein
MKTILICDDDEMLKEITTVILEQKGYKVTTMESSAQLLETVQNLQPDLILMDLMVPPIGGEAAVKLLKENSRTNAIPILVFSGNLEIEQISKRIDADGFIKKPFEISELERIIDAFLQ